MAAHAQGHGAAAGAAILLLALAAVGFRLLAKRTRAGSRRGADSLAAGLRERARPAPGDSVEKKMQAKMAGQADLQARLEAEALEAIKSPTPGDQQKRSAHHSICGRASRKTRSCQVQTLRTWLNEKA